MQSRAEQRRSEQSRAKQSRQGLSTAKQSRARAEASRATQSCESLLTFVQKRSVFFEKYKTNRKPPSLMKVKDEKRQSAPQPAALAMQRCIAVSLATFRFAMVHALFICVWPCRRQNDLKMMLCLFFKISPSQN